MVPPRTPGRKERFEAALRLAQLTAEAWARAPEYGGGVTRHHLYYVLKGARQSPRLIDAVDRFIVEMAPAMAPEMAPAA